MYYFIVRNNFVIIIIEYISLIFLGYVVQYFIQFFFILIIFESTFISFDNIINFTFYLKTNESIKPFDLTDSQNIKLIFKGESDSLEVAQFIAQDNTAPTLGMCGFKIREQDFNRLRDIYTKGGRLFYIVCTNQGFRCMIYTGLFTVEEPVVIIPDGISNPARVLVPQDAAPRGIALVSRKVVETNIANSSFGQSGISLSNL